MSRWGLAAALLCGLCALPACARRGAPVGKPPAPTVPTEDRIDLLSLFDAQPAAAGPGDVRRRFALLRDQMREALVFTPPSTVRLPAVPLHAGAVLSFGYGVERPAGGTAPPVTFVIRVETGGERREVFRGVLPVLELGRNGWVDGEAKLPQGLTLRGEVGTIELEVTGGDPAVRAAFSWPVVYSDGVPDRRDRTRIEVTEPRADLLASFAEAEREPGSSGAAPERIVIPPRPGVLGFTALVVPDGAAVRWRLRLGPGDRVLWRYHAVRAPDRAAAPGRAGFELRVRERPGAGEPGPWKRLAEPGVDLATVAPGWTSIRTLEDAVEPGAAQDGDWELEVRGRIAGGDAGLRTGFTALGVWHREQVPRRSRAAGGRNLVLLLVDTLRADHLGVYGYERETSPELDRLAGAGVVFEDVLAPGPSTLPSTASLLTGLYPDRHGVFAEALRRLPPGAESLAVAAARAGYTTAAFVANPFLVRGTGFERGFEYYVEDIGMDAARVNRDVVRWIGRHREERFVLYVHYLDPHAPYAAPGEFYSLFDPEYVGGVDHNTVDVAGRRWSRLLFEALNRGFPVELRDDLGEDARYTSTALQVGRPLMRRMVDLYDGEIRFWDAQLPSLRAALRDAGLEDETVVAVVADHGEEFGEGGRFGHGFRFEPRVLHVPWVLFGAGVGPARRDRSPRSLVDVMPTLLEAAGVPVPEGLDGRSAWAGAAAAERTRFSFTLSYAPSPPWEAFTCQPAALARTAGGEVVHEIDADRWWERRGERLEPLSSPPAGAAELREREARLPNRRTPEERDDGATARELEALQILGYVQ